MINLCSENWLIRFSEIYFLNYVFASTLEYEILIKETKPVFLNQLDIDHYTGIKIELMNKPKSKQILYKRIIPHVSIGSPKS